MKRSKKKSFRVLSRKPCGGESPYWNWVYQHGKMMDDGTWMEYPEANPDVLPESAHLWDKELPDVSNDKLVAIHEAFDKLSKLEQWVVRLCGFNGLSVEQTALKLKLSVNTIKTVLQRAQKKIRKLFVTRYGHLGRI